MGYSVWKCRRFVRGSVSRPAGLPWLLPCVLLSLRSSPWAPEKRIWCVLRMKIFQLGVLLESCCKTLQRTWFDCFKYLRTVYLGKLQLKYKVNIKIQYKGVNVAPSAVIALAFISAGLGGEIAAFRVYRPRLNCMWTLLLAGQRIYSFRWFWLNIRWCPRIWIDFTWSS